VQLESLLKAYGERTDRTISARIPAIDQPPGRLHEAMRYSALAPGKRLRPALVFLSAQAVAEAETPGVELAAASVELVHAFSLIHDDLPAIDNDDLRRGRPTCHRQFDEATAILAGDALFALAFRMALEAPNGAAVAAVLADASFRLVQGEAQDIYAEGTETSPEVLVFIHAQKTAALIAAACQMGALAAGADAATVEHFRQYGEKVGLAFQIADDILNVTATAEALGKASGSDAARGKATYPAAFGLDHSRTMARQLVEEAIPLVPSEPLKQLARFSIERVS
jgi:geranylgeranyl pyrophosphate synthase